MMKFFFIIFLTIAILTIVFLKKGATLEKEIIEYYDTNCKSEKGLCLIDLTKIVSDWDFIYIFNKGVSDIEIEKVIGCKYDAKEDLSYKFIIIKNEQIKSFFEVFIPPFKKNNNYLTFDYEHIIDNGNKLDSKEFSFYKLSKDNHIIALNKIDVMIGDNSKYTIYKAYPINKGQIADRIKSAF